MLSHKIVDKLLSSYEKSKAFLDASSKRKIELKISDRFFEGYRNGSQELDIALEQIESLGICDIQYRDEYLERIILKTDPLSIEKAYAFANRSDPKGRHAKIKSLFESKSDSDSPIIRAFCAYALESLQSGRPDPIENTYGTLDEISIAISCIESIERLESDVTERVFSANVLGDSKLFALHRKRIAKIIRDFSDVPFDEDDDPLIAYGVIQNRTYAFIKGDAKIRLGEQEIDLHKYDNELALSDKMIDQMSVLSVSSEELYTIENLTSFHEFDHPNAIIVYLGGFHNSVRRKLILKIHEANPSMRCYHYGDIDAGGFYILNHLREKTGISFMPYLMDKETLMRFIDKAKDITKSDEKRLEKMKKDARFAEFLPVIQYILDNRKKLEQEAELEISR